MAAPGAGASDQRETRVKRALSNPVFFAEAYFAPYDPNWTTLLPEFARDMMRFVVSARPWPLVGGVVMLPPEFLKPLSGETLVLMGDGERRRLADVRVGDMVVTHLGRARRVQAVADQGLLDCLSVQTFAGRTIVAAPDHPLLTPDGWVNAGDLRVGDTLGAVPYVHAGDGVDVRAARLAGYFVGDGAVGGSSANIYCYDELQGQDIIRCAEGLGFTVNRKLNNKTDDRLCRYALRDGVRPWLVEHDMRGRNSRSKRVPEFIMRGGVEAARHFVGAYFACDGTVAKRGKRGDVQVVFSSVSRELLCDVRHLLTKLGIRASVREHRQTVKGAPYISWTLRSGTQDDVAKFVDTVPVFGVKADRLLAGRPQRRAFDSGLIADAVTAIEPAGEHHCYCLRVAEDSSFTADDIAVHNTTLISQVYPLWLTTRARVMNQLLRGMLFSEQEDMAKGNLAVVKWHIVNNERLAGDFTDKAGRPLLMPDPDMPEWAEDAIIVHRPGIVSRDKTWQAKGMDSTGIQGRRLDVVIADDIVTPRNASSPAKRKSALEMLDLTVEPRLVEGAQIIIAGNFNDSKDLLSTKAQEARYRLFKRPTLHKPGKPDQAPAEADLADPERSIETWPANWSRKRALIEWHAKPHRFRRIHLLDPRADQGDRLQTGWVTRVPDADGAALLRYAKFFIGVDPAPGGDALEDLDFFNVSVVALTLHHADLVQSFSVRADTPRQVDLLGRIHDSYQHVGFGVIAIGGAKVAMDRYFRGSVEIKRPDLKRKLEEISVPEHEAAKEVRLEGLGPQANAGWLRVWESVWEARTSDAADQQQELTFAGEWREFPYGAHDDRLDGCDIALRTAAEFALVGDHDWEMSVAGG